MATPALTRRTFVVTTALAAASRWSFAEQQRIRVGCQANGFPQRANDFPQLLEILRDMKQLDYEGFETNVRFVRDQFARAAEARKAIAGTGVVFTGMHLSMPGTADAEFAATAEGGAALGAENIVMSSGGLSPEGTFTPDALHAKCEHLNELGKVCREKHIQLAYHNHMPEFANHNAEIEGLANGTDPALVKFLVDCGHAYQGGGDPAAFMLRHSRRIVGCHLKTFLHKTKQVPLGHGDFGFEELAKAIRKTDWSGWLIAEEGNGSPQGGDTAALGPDRQYIRKTFGV